ncbi:hypothetical protein CHS0354_040275 [Potamilus streckersoni]|uniref:Transmembrane protein n=1 Tax=Potamilus streckersoni TaxID=2493646 RepID=A0AAE0S4T4_9BIVA|nr:hypothetical protein CHS0354_040275 [Potamilus streckersoni]
MNDYLSSKWDCGFQGIYCIECISFQMGKVAYCIQCTIFQIGTGTFKESITCSVPYFQIETEAFRESIANIVLFSNGDCGLLSIYFILCIIYQIGTLDFRVSIVYCVPFFQMGTRFQGIYFLLCIIFQMATGFQDIYCILHTFF